MKILINGTPREISSQQIEGLLKELDLPAQAILVEHNGVALHRSEWDSITLAENDRLEMIRIVAGG